MNLRRPLAISFGLVLAMLVLSVCGWVAIPGDAQLPVHWGIDGRPDGFAPTAIALLAGPGLGLLLTVVFAALPRIEPRRAHLDSSAKPYHMAWVGGLVLLLLRHAGAVAVGLGFALDVGRLVLAGLGALLIVIGNWLPKTRSNFVLGIRTPWTLLSERSWSVTHRLAGRGFVLVGLAQIALAALGAAVPLTTAVLFVGLAGLVAGLVVVSYRVWRSDPDRIPLGCRNRAS